MRRCRIPGTSCEVSCLCLGTAPFGSSMDEKQSFAQMDAFVNLGGNFLDTAHGYADWVTGCRGRCVSEKTIGSWMRARRNRDTVVVGTKGGWINHDTRRLMSSREELIAQIERSRMELGVDCIDIYWLHRDDPHYLVAHFVDLLNEQRELGRISSFGCSNWTVSRIREANAYAAANRLQGFSANQMWWSLARPDLGAYGDATTVGMDAEGMEFHRQTGMLAMPYSPQAMGFYSKLDARGVDGLDDFYRRIFGSPENIARLTRLQTVAAEVGASIAQVALAWVMSHPFPTIPIIGCSTKEQMIETVKAADIRLEPRIWPTQRCHTGGLKRRASSEGHTDPGAPQG